jgi:dihydrofolate reductase
MRVTVYLGLTIDGFVARSDDRLDFLPAPREPEPGEVDDFSAFLATVDAMVMGRRTYEVVRGFGFDPYGDLPIFVLSRSMDAFPEGTPANLSLVAGRPDEVLASLGPDVKHVYIDGASTARAFLAAGCVTDLILTQVPVLIGEGISLFGPLPHDVPVELVATKTLPGGMSQVHWRVR